MVQHQVSRTYEGKDGKEVTSMEHRAGWDATFSAPKSGLLTALVGATSAFASRTARAFEPMIKGIMAELGLIQSADKLLPFTNKPQL